jgi:hypothetical protein
MSGTCLAMAYVLHDNNLHHPQMKSRLYSDESLSSRALQRLYLKQVSTKHQSLSCHQFVRCSGCTRPGADHACCSLTCVIKSDTLLHHQKSYLTSKAVWISSCSYDFSIVVYFTWKKWNKRVAFHYPYHVSTTMTIISVKLMNAPWMASNQWTTLWMTCPIIIKSLLCI